MTERGEKRLPKEIEPEQIEDMTLPQTVRPDTRTESELVPLSLLEREALTCPRCGEPLGIKKLYHIFTHDRDEWLESFDEAMGLFNRWSAENDSARLYEQYYWRDPELSDEPIREDCLFSHGPYPR